MDKRYWVCENEKINPQTLEVINDFLGDTKDSRAVNTIKKRRCCLEKFFISCQKPLNDLTPDDLRDWLSAWGRDKKPRTIAGYIDSLSVFFKDCLENGHVNRLLVKKRWRPRLPKTVPKYLEKSEQAKVRLQAERRPLRDRAIYEFLLSSGCRCSEAAGLDVQDVDLPKRTATVTGKGDKTRDVHFSETCAILLKRYLSVHPKDREALFLNRFGGRLSREGIWVIISGLGKKAGLDRGIYPHRLRHTFATNLLARGAQMNIIKEELGHAHEETTGIYANLPDPVLVALYRKYMG
jgi:site-specific recombinase XerD